MTIAAEHGACRSSIARFPRRWQEAADRALDVARRLTGVGVPTQAEAIAAIVALRTVASDLMVFAAPSQPRAPFGLRRSTR